PDAVGEIVHAHAQAKLDARLLEELIVGDAVDEIRSRRLELEQRRQRDDAPLAFLVERGLDAERTGGRERADGGGGEEGSERSQGKRRGHGVLLGAQARKSSKNARSTASKPRNVCSSARTVSGGGAGRRTFLRGTRASIWSMVAPPGSKR